MPAAHPLMRSVQRVLDDLQLTGDAPTAEWTSAVKTALCELGNTFQYWVYAKAGEVPEASRDGGEWLYDVIWLDYEGERLSNVALVAECEWQGPLQIISDFQKLVLSRAELRVMIFDGRFQPSGQAMVGEFAGQISGFAHSREGDAWLFGAWELADDRPLGWRFRWLTLDGNEPVDFPPSRQAGA